MGLTLQVLFMEMLAYLNNIFVRGLCKSSCRYIEIFFKTDICQNIEESFIEMLIVLSKCSVKIVLLKCWEFYFAAF